MAIGKTLLLLVALTCLFSTASASIMLEKWIDLFNDLNFNNFMKVAMWQLWSTLAPLAAGLVRVLAYELYYNSSNFTDDIRYGAPAAGIAHFEDFFAYIMNFALYELVFKTLGVAYTADEFVLLDLEALGNDP